MARGILIILFALFIDGLQAGVSAGFLMLGSYAGTAGGAVAGASACSNAGTIIAGGCAVIAGALGTLINPGLAVVGVPLGVGFGIAANICISLSMGSALIAILAMNGMFNARYVVGVFIGEAIPGLDNLPGWTFLAVRSVLQKSAKSGKGLGSIATGIAGAVLSPKSPAGILGGTAQYISNTKQNTGAEARSSTLINSLYETKPVRNLARQRYALASEVGREIQPPQAPTNLYAPSAH